MIWQILRTVIITTARKAKSDNLAISDHFRRVYAGDGFLFVLFYDNHFESTNESNSCYPDEKNT